MPLAETILSGVATAATTTATNEGIKNAGGITNLLSQNALILIGSGIAIGAASFLSKGKNMPVIDLPKNWGLAAGAILVAAGAYGKFAPSVQGPPAYPEDQQK